MNLGISRDERDGWMVLAVLGDLEMGSAPDLKRAVIAALADGADALVIDLGAVGFIDSTGLGVLIGALRRCRANGAELQLVCAEPRLRELFASVDLDRVFELHVDVAAATGVAL